MNTKKQIEKNEKIIEDAKIEGKDELAVQTEKKIERLKGSIELLEKNDKTKEDEEELQNLLE
jgi:hypothetical protein